MSEIRTNKLEIGIKVTVQRNEYEPVVVNYVESFGPHTEDVFDGKSVFDEVCHEAGNKIQKLLSEADDAVSRYKTFVNEKKGK